MIYVSYLLLIIVFLIDVIFYLPIKVHIFMQKNEFYLYLYSFPLVALGTIKKINRLKNKLDLSKLSKPKKEDIGIIEAIHLHQLNICIPYQIANQKAYLFYPLLALNNIHKNYKIKITSKGHFYICIHVQIVNIIKEIIIIRRSQKNAKPN